LYLRPGPGAASSTRVHYPRRLLRVLSPEEVARLREEEAQRHRAMRDFG
jgi:hypothetical protein